MSSMYNPVSTYRIQFHKDFTLRSLEAIIPYLQKLGIKTLYASPVFESVPGSMHGYDGVNPLRINPEIGTEDDLRRISKTLHEAGIGWLQDIVPNHMAFHPANAWLMDVLQLGQDSRYASYFDIDWSGDGKLMVPVLGDTLDEVIEKGELRLVNEKGHFLDYSGNRFPLKPGAYPENPDAKKLNEIAGEQHYRLCHWQETDHTINYRRFFTVNGLICLNIQDEAVFREVHKTVAELCNDGVFDGLRIDHIDGLYDPTTYLERLRSLCGPSCYIVVEKILQPSESIPKRWPIAGTTGYDFLGLVNNLLTSPRAEKRFTQVYKRISHDTASPGDQAHEKKEFILRRHMGGELGNLSRLAGRLLPDLPLQDLEAALAAVLIHCPVYRYYANRLPLSPDEAKAVGALLASTAKDHPELGPALQRLQQLLLDEPLDSEPARTAEIAHFYRRLMQYTGPLMAKGVEDTLMYTYDRFIVHNEVGDAPESFGISVEDFHRAMIERQNSWPLAQNATSTHDTKRGEDGRAFLNALSHVPDRWFSAVNEWRAMNRMLRQAAGPDARDEYFIYQTLIASYPLIESGLGTYPERLAEYLRKALREGKRRSDWARPDEAYEQATIDFATQLIKPESAFLKHFTAFRDSLLDGGIALALSQLLLKVTTPGLPDIYQGTEHWDLSLVDPDNRRPVDYELRTAMFDATIQTPSTFTEQWDDLSNSRLDGRIKLMWTAELLRLRSDRKELFENGTYLPLRVTGANAGKLIAFARRHRRKWLIVAASIGLNNQGAPMTAGDWKGTKIVLPQAAPAVWQTPLGGDPVNGGETLYADELLAKLPFAILEGELPENKRSAGILLPISSLPGRFPIGDLGPEAKRFARSLSRAGQRIWQLLPLNPISAAADFSPYSSDSTMAGNTVLISPELLAEQGLIDALDLEGFTTQNSDSIDYSAAITSKKPLLDLAYQNYCKGDFASLKSEVEGFQEREQTWLTDYALYTVIKAAQGGKPWYEWPESLRAKGSSDAQRFREIAGDAILRIVWEQAIFSMQWRSLKAYCNDLGIELIGDLPFYLSYDSADVWANQHLFSLNESGAMTGVAGVPPDYFSETGQLWGMPTYNWEQHGEQGYSWWIERLRRNLELYDSLRIDHFRALAEYWEVPAGEDTAINGRWLQGPDTAFFDVVRDALGKMPFIAEDLGDNMEKVYLLRDAVALPGMKVMQFAFGDNHPVSVDVPHNYTTNSICYTGTHDNNTTLGWFRNETSPADRRRLEAYVGRNVSEKNVNEIMARLCYGAVSQRAILPMQDVLGLDERHRMNMPSSGSGNWRWRMLPGAFDLDRQKALFRLTQQYNRL